MNCLLVEYQRPGRDGWTVMRGAEGETFEDIERDLRKAFPDVTAVRRREPSEEHA